MRRILSFLLFLFISFSAIAGNFYVDSVGGNDANAGTSPGAAWQTLTKVNSHTYTNSDSLFFKRGEFYPGAFRPNHLLWVGFYGSGEDPTIDGFIPVTNWVNNGGGVYAAYCPSCSATENLVMINGRPQIIARSPNTGWSNFTTYNSSTQITGTGLTGTPSYVGTNIAIRSSHFTIDRALITVQNVGTLTFDNPVTYTNAGGTGYFLYNNDAFLDQFGEWTWNPVTDTLKVFFGANNPASYNVLASAVDTVLYTGGGTKTFDHLKIRGGNMYNVFIANSTNIVIQNCHSTFSGGINIYANNVPGFTVQNDTTDFGLSGGVTIVGTSPSVYVGHNYIAHSGNISGMGLSGSGATYEGLVSLNKGLYEFNTIDSSGYTGLSFGGDSSVVQNNTVSNYCFIKDDGGGIYTWDAVQVGYTFRRKIINNTVFNGFANIGGIANDQASAASGIYVDGFAINLLIDGNTVYNNSSNGIFTHNGAQVTITNNNVLANIYAQIQVAEVSGNPITGLSLKNNTITNSLIGQKLFSATTVLNDLTNFGIVDSNTYFIQTGDNTPFHTITSANFPGTVLSFSSWQSATGFDLHSSFPGGGGGGNPSTSVTFNTKFKTGWSTDSANARVTIPQWYGTSAPTDSGQAIICFLGAGEVGTDTSFLTKYGPHSYIKGGWDGGVTLGNGLHYPIIITIQEPALYYRPFYYKRILDTIMTRYKIFRRSLHLTGYSMGGWTSNQIAIYRPTTTDSTYAFRPKSIVNVQGVKPDDTYDATPAPYPAGFPSFARNGGYQTIGREWGFEQSGDFRDINTIITTMNGAVAGSAKYQQTSFGSGGHGSFEQWYGSPTNVPQTWVGFHPAVTENIYQFMLRQGDTVADQHGGTNVPPTVSAGGNQSINLPVNQITLTGAATGNNGASIASTLWTKLSGPAATITNPTTLITTVTGLVQGNYVFQLSATDNNNLTTTATMNLTVNGASAAPTVDAGGPYIVDQSNAYDLILQGVATGSNLKISWSFPCNCYTGNDNLTPTSFTGGDPRVLKIVAPNKLNAQVIQMKLNGGDSVHRYKLFVTATDSVSGQSAIDSCIIIYRYWNRFPPQNVDGARGGHFCTTTDHNNFGCTVGSDWVITGANGDQVRGQFTSILMYPTWSDTFHVNPGAKVYVNGTGPDNIADYFNIHFEWDTAGGAGSQPLGDTVSGGGRIVFTNYGGKVRTQAGTQFVNIINTKITSKYDPVNHTGNINWQGHANGYAYTDTSYGWETNDWYRSIAGHGWVLEGISSQWVEFEYLSSIRGNFSGFNLKAEYSGILNPNTRSQLFWNRLQVHDCLAKDAHGENFYIMSANDPAVKGIGFHIYNNRSFFSGNKLYKVIDQFTRDTVNNNVGAFGSINFRSCFERDVSVGYEMEFCNGGNLSYRNIIDGFGNQGPNIILQKFKGPNPTGSNLLRNNLFYHSWGRIGGFGAQEDSAQVLNIDSCFFGGHTDFRFNQVYNGTTGTNTQNQFLVLTAGGLPPQATLGTYNITNNTYDLTKTTLVTGNGIFNQVANIQVGALTPPSYVNSGFPVGIYVEQWNDSVFRMWGDEYAGQTDVMYGVPVVYSVGQWVKWFDKFYISKINNNVGNPPTGVTDANWTLVQFSNGGTTPPLDVRLTTGDPYLARQMGLLSAGVPPPPNQSFNIICRSCGFFP